MVELQSHITAGDLCKISCPVLAMATDLDMIIEEQLVVAHFFVKEQKQQNIVLSIINTLHPMAIGMRSG